MEEAFGYCLTCEHGVLLRRQRVNHPLHAVIAVLTAGIWLIGWAVNARRRAPWHCGTCGASRVRFGAGAPTASEGVLAPSWRVAEREIARAQRRVRRTKLALCAMLALLALTMVLSHL